MNVSSKIYTLLILTILALGLLASIPIHVQASTGHPILGAVNSRSNPTAFSPASSSVSLKAGSDEVSKIDGSPATGYLAIVFAIDTTNLVTFSGSQFDLYISKDGYSAISPDDKKYASGFLVSDLNGPIKKVTKSNSLLKGGKADFYIGYFNDGTHTYKVLIGPIPFDITPDYKYIKIFDGAATSVAVSAQIVEILPAIELTPTEGPAGALVTLKGVALEPNALLNITYGNAPNTGVIAQVWTSSDGKFTYSWNIKDLKSEWTGTGPIPSGTVYVYVWYNETGEFVDSVTYEEYYRAFVQLKSLKYGDEALSFVNLYTGAGNDTLTLDVHVFDKIVVAGAWWNPTGAVSFSVDGKSLGSVTPNATGFFNVTLDVPELTVGEHTVKVTNAGVTYVFYIYVYPTLVLTPAKGYVGDVVEAKVYGFPAKVLVGIWWYGYYGWSNLVNGTTGPDGKFNVTVTFKVPNDYGGDHDVMACYPWDACDEAYANAKFKILPKLEVVPSTFSNDGSEVRVIGTGFDPDTAFTVNIDNQFIGVNNDKYWITPIWVNGTGNIEIVFIAAGFRPGLHVVALYPEAYEPPYAPAAYALFTVTDEGDLIAGLLKSINASIVEIRDGVAVIKTDVGEIKVKLDAVNASISGLIVDSKGEVLAKIDTAVGTILARLDAINAVITSIQGNVATIKTDVGTIKADVGTIKSIVENNNALLLEIKDGVAVIKTDVGTIKADVAAIKPVITSIQGDVATIKTDVGTIKADVAAIKPVVTEIKDGVATINTALGDLKGVVTTINGNVATIMTDVGTIKADVSTVKSGVEDVKSGISGVRGDVSGVMYAVIAAVILSLIAAVAAIYSVMSIRKALVH